MPALILIAVSAILVLIMYLLRDKTEWVYEGKRRHDKANPKRVQVWDDSVEDDWISGMWVDA